MSDQDDDKKNINQDTTDNESVNQPLVDENNQPEGVDSTNNESSSDENKINDQIFLPLIKKNLCHFSYF